MIILLTCRDPRKQSNNSYSISLLHYIQSMAAMHVANVDTVFPTVVSLCGLSLHKEGDFET